MAKYRIGITEAGDAGVDLSWKKRLDSVDGAILVTKDCNERFRTAVLDAPNKLIIHATTTGMGDTMFEPNVPSYVVQIENVRQLIRLGFPIERIVARVDPIIPCPCHIKLAYQVIWNYLRIGVRRFRVSVIDMYPHVRKRFENRCLVTPYGENFSASDEQFAAVDEMLKKAKHLSFAPSGVRYDHPAVFECCAEPKLKVPLHSGCISNFDLDLLGLDDDSDTRGFQRRDCMCYPGKVELLSGRHPCEHRCLYCYWKTKSKYDF